MPIRAEAGRLCAAWLIATTALVVVTLAELHFRLRAGALIPIGSDYLAALQRSVPFEAAWAALGVALVALLRWRWERARRLSVGGIAVVVAIDAAARQFLGEAWLGAVVEARLDPTPGPALLYFVVLPTVASGAAVLAAALVSRRVVAAGTAALLVACIPRGQASPSSGPNLLLVTIDTWRYDHLSAHPEAVDATLTPNLDRLASRGHLFTQARAHAPVTVPSHSSMLSGRAPWETGILTNGGRIPADVPWLPSGLRAAGWTTGAVVSGAVIRGERGFERGFDRFHDDLRDPPRVDDLVALRLARLLRGVDDPRVFRAESDRAVRRADAFLDSVPTGRPWFLWVHLYNVHLPHSVSEASAPEVARALDGLPDPCEYRDHPVPLSGPGGLGLAPALGPGADRERERRCAHVDRLQQRVASYKQEVRVADAAVGELLSLVEARGETDSTAVLVTADHGESLTEHGMRMAHQFSAYEPVLRVPLLVVPPGGSEPHRSAALVQHRDLPATATALLGLEDATGGQSWLTDVGRPTVTSVIHVPSLTMRRAMRRDREQAPVEPKRAAPVRVAVRDGLRSLVLTPGLPTEFYDLGTDGSQLRDLVSLGELEAPEDLVDEARRVVERLSDRDPERLDPKDADLEALRALGYVE